MLRKTEVDKPYGVWTLEDDDLKRFDWWMTYDPIHEPEPMTPLAGCVWADLHQHGYCHSAEKIKLPVSKGVCCRLDSRGYMALSKPMATNSKEFTERQASFKKYSEPFVESFEEIWGDFRHKGKVGSRLLEIQQNYAQIRTFNLDTWSFDVGKFFSFIRNLSNGDLFNLFLETLKILRRHWEIHFEIMYVMFSLYTDFEVLTKRLLKIDDNDPRFLQLMQGFDNKIYECDQELWRLSRLAADLNIVNVLERAISSRQTFIELTQTENGEKWLQQFNEFLVMHGRRSAVSYDILKPTWLEEPAPALKIIRDYCLMRNFDYESFRKTIQDTRERIELEFLKKVPLRFRDDFERLLKAAQTAYCWHEDHHHWIEYLGFSSIRYIVLEMGKRLREGKAIKNSKDIFFLNPDEIRATFPLAVEGKYDFSKLAHRRKANWKTAFREIPPKIRGNWVREQVKDPIMIKIFGLGTLPEPSEQTDVIGHPGAPGVVEGIARVITDVDEIYRVNSGEILVIRAASPVWTPIFAKIKGVVTDHGGSLSHAAIVSREYGIPAIVGAVNATKRIRDGQRILINGNQGWVRILK